MWLYAVCNASSLYKRLNKSAIFEKKPEFHAQRELEVLPTQVNIHLMFLTAHQ